MTDLSEIEARRFYGAVTRYLNRNRTVNAVGRAGPRGVQGSAVLRGSKSFTSAGSGGNPGRGEIGQRPSDREEIRVSGSHRGPVGRVPGVRERFLIAGRSGDRAGLAPAVFSLLLFLGTARRTAGRMPGLHGFPIIGCLRRRRGAAGGDTHDEGRIAAGGEIASAASHNN